ncbi:MAG: carbohydrate kinase family protein [Planctomycetota bacterium]|nr:carbohydrate kinase family protein [Planctomycetota bacterium]
MARQRTIVGLGEALLLEYPDRTEPAGLGALVALQAARLGHVGIAITRIGQDDAAEELIRLLDEGGATTTHIQRDPDLPTGRVIERPIGGRVARYLDTQTSFDNLQADFDLEDVAQQADAVVYGMLTRRGGQTRSEENRFLAACGAAIKLFDLTNRVEAPNRGQAMSGLEHADAAVVDQVAIESITPGWGEAPMRDAALHLLREADLSLLLTVEQREAQAALTAHTAEKETSTTVPVARGPLLASLVGFLHVLLAGRQVESALELAHRVGDHVATRGDEPIPEAWRE